MMKVGVKPKKQPSTDCCLQLDNMKKESLVIEGKNTSVNLAPSGLLTAHQGLKVKWSGRRLSGIKLRTCEKALLWNFALGLTLSTRWASKGCLAIKFKL